VTGGLVGLKKFRGQCQEATHDELIESLKITLQEALAFNREEALLNAALTIRRAYCAVKRSKLIKYLTAQGCELLREGWRHIHGWHNQEHNKRSTIPRHAEIKIFWRTKFVRSGCKAIK